MNCRFWPTLTLLAHCARRVWRTQWHQPFCHRGLSYFLNFHILYKLSTCLQRTQKDMMNTMTSTLLAPGARRAPHPQDCHILTFHILYKVALCQKGPTPSGLIYFLTFHILYKLSTCLRQTQRQQIHIFIFLLFIFLFYLLIGWMLNIIIHWMCMFHTLTRFTLWFF